MEKYYLAALASVLGYAAPRKVFMLANYFGSAREAYEAPLPEVFASGIIQGKLQSYYCSHWQKSLPNLLAEYCANNKVQIISLKETHYPQALKTISVPPVVLYVKGQLPQGSNYLAIVGSRKASSYGLRAAEEFAAKLALENMTVVSGGAKGIDASAHKGALKVKGSTIAVLGSGIDLLYPAINSKIFAAILENGAIVSEFAPGVKPLPQNFPMRNRIIVGLCRGVLVVEAAQKSGAMITADIALEENREVYCLPGNIYSATSKGTNGLIKEGAMLVDAPEEILEDYGLLLKERKPVKIEKANLFSNLSNKQTAQADLVLAMLTPGEVVTLEEIVTKTELALSIVSGILLDLQISGLLRQQPGQRYMRV
ncbi:MAG: DNA-processing protein DprA [Acidaminococcaceae bacterium]